MANPRQRNKQRSHKKTKPSANSVRRMHQKLRRVAPLVGPEVLQDSWDKTKTVFQNYAALGLLPSIPLPKSSLPSTHSRKIRLPYLPPVDVDVDDNGSGSGGAGGEGSVIPKGFGRIVRDSQGNVVDIILAEDGDDEGDGEGDVLMEKEEGVEEDGMKIVEAKTDVVRSLEILSASSQPVKRHSSTSEHAWLVQLVNTYGDDTQRMTRDKKLNVWQKTEGEIRRMIKKAGGVERLRS